MMMMPGLLSSISAASRLVDNYTTTNASVDNVIMMFSDDASSPPTTACPNGTPVFWQGLAGSACYRIPSVIQTPRGTLLAFSEARLKNCGDQGQHDLVVRRSFDGGLSWGPVATVVAGRSPCAGCPPAVSNPSPVIVRGRPDDGSYYSAILLAFDTMNNPTSSHHGRDEQLWSEDDGATWGRRANLSYSANRGGLLGPSVGLQADDGTLYYSYIAPAAPHLHHLLWSADEGVTWTSSDGVAGLGECAIAFLVSPADGRILMNCRTGSHRRAQLVWSARGTPLTNVSFPAGLSDAGCQGSVINERGTLYLSNAADARARAHLTVKRSVDRGASWSAGVDVHPGPAAYSQLVGLGAGRGVGVLFEAGKASPYEAICWKAVDVF